MAPSALDPLLTTLVSDLAAADALVAAQPELLSARNRLGETALHFLSVENEVDAVRWLIARGCDVNTRSASGDSVLADAAALGLERIVALLLEHGANTNCEGGLYGPPLARASTVAVTDLLLKAGADPRSQTDDGTPLHCCLRVRNRLVAERLLAAGASLEATDDIGETPLHAAAAGGDASHVRWLLSLGADPHARNDFGGTTLHAAVLGNSPEVADVLLAAGVDPHLTTNQGETARQLALRMGMHAVAGRLNPATPRG